MKKNLKSCVERLYFSEPDIVLDVNDYELISRSGLTPDLRHKKTAHISAMWQFANAHRARILLGEPNLSSYRYLTFSVYAVNGEGGSFHIRFESDKEASGEGGYGKTLPILHNGWNDYRLELPFLQARGAVQGWEHIRAIVLDCAIGGQANHSDTQLSFDSFYGWEELAPQSYVRMPELKGAALFSKAASYAIVDRTRLPISPDLDPSARPYEAGGVLWLPMAPIAAIRAHRAVADTKANTLSFTYRRRKYVFYGNSDRYTVNGEEQPLPFRPAVRGSALFFPAEYLCGFFHWRQLFTDPTGIAVLSNRKQIFHSDRDASLLWELNAEITYTQPTGEGIMEDLRRKISNPDKGRLLLLPEEWMALRKSVKTDAALKELLEALKARFGKRSESYLAAPIFAEAAEINAATIASVTERLLSFSVLFRMTGEKPYAERAALECEALAALSGWNAESSIADATDLGFAMAFAYDLCHTAWSEGRKALLERTMLRYAMRPGVDCYNGRGMMWRQGTSTAARINRSLTAMALTLAYVYPETALRILRHSVRNAVACFEAYSPDGGYAEGLAGWETATTSLALLIAMLESACGSDYGLSSFCGFAATARFPIHTETANGAWNFHNCPAAPVSTAVFGWFTKKYNNPLYAWLRRRDLTGGSKQPDALDLVFYTPVDEELQPELPPDAVYRNAGAAAFRSDWSSEGSLLALHGGSNHAVGGELDAGSFLLEMGGERFFCETGGNTALPVMLRHRAEGQNTIVIDPVAEPAPDQNPDAVATILEARSTADHAYAVVDMTSTNDLIVKGRRGILLTENRTLAVIQDELTLVSPAKALWSAYTTAKATRIGKRTLLLEKNGKTLLCKLVGGASACFELLPTADETLTRVCVSVEVKEKLRLAVACKLMNEGTNASEKLYEMKPMRAWEI